MKMFKKCHIALQHLSFSISSNAKFLMSGTVIISGFGTIHNNQYFAHFVFVHSLGLIFSPNFTGIFVLLSCIDNVL